MKEAGRSYRMARKTVPRAALNVPHRPATNTQQSISAVTSRWRHCISSKESRRGGVAVSRCRDAYRTRRADPPRRSRRDAAAIPYISI